MRSAGGKHLWPVPAGVRSCAIYSTDPQKDYRYVLYRSWSMATSPLAVFVGLNPSTAQARFDDPTVQKCWMWARDRGFGRFAMLNLFAYRATDQRDLWANTNDPIGPRNDEYIRETVLDGVLVVAAWGNGQRRQAAVEARAGRTGDARGSDRREPSRPHQARAPAPSSLRREVNNVEAVGVIVYAVVDDALSPDFPLGVELEVFVPPRGRRAVYRGGAR